MLITLRIHHLCRNWSCWKLRRIRFLPRYPVAKTTPEEYQDIVKQSPADLRDPENVKTTIEYDLKTNTYIVRTKLGDMEIGTPMSLTPAEYQDYSMQQSLRSYFRQKNEEEFQKATNKQFNLTDMQFNIGAAERIFGPRWEYV